MQAENMVRLADLALGIGCSAMIGALAIRFKSIKSTVTSVLAMRHHDVRTIVLEVGEQKFRISVDGSDTDVSSLRDVQSAVARAKARALEPA